MNKIAIIGTGSILYQDEGIGVYALKYIEENFHFLDDVSLVDGGVLGLGLMQYYQEYDKVIIIDTITMDDEIGSIYNLPAKELIGLGSYKQSAHEVEIVEALEICSLLDKMAEVNIIGIIPKDIKSINIGLTQEMKSKFLNLIEATIQELDKSGVEYEKTLASVGLDAIINSYVNVQKNNSHS